MRIFGTILAAVAVAIIGLVAYVVIYWAFYAVDSTFMPYSTTSGVITDRSHIPAHYQTTYISDGKGGGYIQTTYIPDQWTVTMKTPIGTDWAYVNEYNYLNMHNGTNVNVSYQTGRISGKVYLTNPVLKP